MSQKRKATYPPTEGNTEDTDVILEPTTAVPKRARTVARSKAKSEVKEETDLDDAHHFGEDTATEDTSVIPSLEEPTTDEFIVGPDEVAAEPSPKHTYVRRPPNASFPSHLNPTNPSHFDHFLFQLLAFRAETNSGGFNIFKDEYPVLYAWLQHIKKEYKIFSSNSANSILTSQQVLVLESLHVPLTSRGEEHWNRYYELLAQYKARHGHVLVPRVCEVPGLGDWVTDQRRQYKAKHHGQSSQMTDSRQQKLDELGFVWHVRNRPEWEVRYSELIEYKAANGDCKVPQHYKPNRSLGKWVAKQREQYKLRLKGQHSFLTPYREEKLNQIGFSWFVRSALDTEVQTVVDEVNDSAVTIAAAMMRESAIKSVMEGTADPSKVEEKNSAAEEGTEEPPDETTTEV